MKLIKDYILNFSNRSGLYVLLSTVISRAFSFLASWFALQLIPNRELGIILFAYNIIAFIIPFSGLGLHQSLIRYGSLLNSIEEKNALFVYVFKKGLLVAFCVTILVIISSFFISFKFENTGYYLAFLSLVLIPVFLLEIIKIQFRLKHLNKGYSYIEITYNTILVISVVLLSYYFQEIGYVIALIIAPAITFFLFIRKLTINFSAKIDNKITNFKFWKYGFYSGLTSMVSDFLFIIDILLVGYLMTDSEMVTVYKYVSIIPLSILFLPRAFIATDYVSFTEKIKDKAHIFKYIRSYMLFFTAISILLCSFFLLFSENILALFDANYSQYSDSFIILGFGVCGILIFRGLFGNLLCSIGKIEVNYYIISVALIINIFSNYQLIPIYGIKGAAITSAILMWFTGVFSCIWFFYLYKRFLNE
jgi:O-antigen/teichoic acid export membrane protein